MEARSARMAPNDSIATWLLGKSIDELALLPDKELRQMVNTATTLQFLSHDKSAENIFTNNVETWKNIGNFQFIDRVGQCFMAMNTVEEYWNSWVTEVDEATKVITYHPDDYEGETIGIKYMKDEKVRAVLQGIHNRRGWLDYVAATMRYHNRHNMEAMGISEEEVMAFTDDREKGAENNQKPPRADEYYTPVISLDSLVTFRELDLRIDSLKGR